MPVATTELDAPGSKRSFFYFGGTPPLQQGMIQADRVAAYLKAHARDGHCELGRHLVPPDRDRAAGSAQGFEQEAAKLNKTNTFKLHEIAFANTTTDPAKNLSQHPEPVHRHTIRTCRSPTRCAAPIPRTGARS